MACDECLGLIIMGAVSVVIGVLLLKKYYDERNVFTLYMALFFVTAGIGWFIRFIATDWVLNIYEETKEILMLVGVIPQVILLLFVLTFLKTPKIIRIVVIILEIVIMVIHLIAPTLRILIYNAIVIILLNIILFLINWRKNDDIKSLGFSIGLVFILLGESISSFSLLLNGIFLIISAILWIITYSGLLEKVTSKTTE